MSGETLDKMYIALVGEFSRFTREQYAKRIEALGGIICEPKNDIDYIFYGKLPIEQIHEYKYGLETVFGAYNEITLLDKLTEVEMDNQDKLPLSRIEYYQTLPTQPEGCTVFMYEVRRMAQELARHRQALAALGYDPIVDLGNSYTLNMEDILEKGNITGGKPAVYIPGSGRLVLASKEVEEQLEKESASDWLTQKQSENRALRAAKDNSPAPVIYGFDPGAGTLRKKAAGEPIIDLKNREVKVTLRPVGEKDVEDFLRLMETHSVEEEDTLRLADPVKEEWRVLVKDAMRWRAFVSSPAIRFFGSSGLKEERKVSGYAHFGAEFWTIHSGRVYSSEESVTNRKLLTEYADILVHNRTLKADQKIMVTIDNPEWLADNSEAWFEGDELKMDIPLKEVLPVITEWLDTAAILQRAETAATERGIWQSVTLHITGKEPKE